MVAGVASGIAHYFDIDPVLVRIAFVVLAFVGGAGILLYGVAWWLMPPSHPVSNAGENVIRRLKSSPTWLAVVLLILGGALLIDQLGLSSPQVVWGVALIALGVVLFRHASRPAAEEWPEAPREPIPPPAAPGAFRPPPPSTGSALVHRGVSPPTAVSREDVRWTRRAEWRAERRRERSGLGLGTIGAALVVVGTVALLDNANGGIHLSLAQYIGLALAVLGIGLLLGAWWGRARGLIVLGLLLVPPLLVASLVNVPIEGGFGDRTIQPRALRDVSSPYRLVAGRILLDLTTLPRNSGTTRISASVVAGKIEVLAPTNRRVVVTGEVGAGQLDLFGRSSEGLMVRDRVAVGPHNGRRLELNLATSFGNVVVFTEP